MSAGCQTVLVLTIKYGFVGMILMLDVNAPGIIKAPEMNAKALTHSKLFC